MRTVNSFYFNFEQEYLNEGHEEIPNSFYEAKSLAKCHQPPVEWGGWGSLVVTQLKDFQVSPDPKIGTVHDVSNPSI